MKRALWIFILIGALAATSVTAAPQRGGTLRVGLNADPPNLDPHQSTAAVDRQVFQNLYDKLVDINQNLEIVPMLATSWQITDGGRTYTFKLRQGVVFHDGTPFNADAVKFNFERMLDKSFGSPRFNEETARLANLRAGELDVIDQVAPADIPKLRTDPVLRLLERSGLEWQGMWIMVAGPPFNNKLLRQALNATIDRRTLVNVVFGETAVPANGPFPPALFTYDVPANSRIPERNVDLARQKLRDAGMPNGFSFTLKITPGRVAQQVAQVIQSMAADAGIKVNIEIVEFGAILSQGDAHKFEAILLGWSGRPDPDGNIYGDFITDGGLNFSAYSNPRVDTLLDAARILTTRDQRRRAHASGWAKKRPNKH